MPPRGDVADGPVGNVDDRHEGVLGAPAAVDPTDPALAEHTLVPVVHVPYRSVRDITPRRLDGAAGLFAEDGSEQIADVVRNVDGVFAQRLHGDDLECVLVRGRQHDRRGHPVLVGVQPAHRDHTPAVARL